MATKNDNRMAWIRNIEKLKKSDKDSYFIEHEVATECHIPGVLDYDNGKILCGGLTLEKNKDGLRHYLIRIQHAKLEEPYYNDKADKKGYYFRDGILGELFSLFSLFFQRRFYLVASYSGELTNHGLKIKTDNKFIYKSCNNLIHPQIFKDNKKRNFAIGLSDFLNLIKNISSEKHQAIILSSYHYAKALKEVGIDQEMVFIRLVSSIEALSKNIVLKKKDNQLNDRNFKKLFDKVNLSQEESKQLKEILKVNKKNLIKIEKSKLKFIRFIEKYSTGCFKGGNWKAKHVKISKKDLPKTLKKIYDARSEYLHNGEAMYLSQILHGGEMWDTDPSLGMIIDSRKVPASKKLPYGYWFENIVRCSFLNYLKEQAELKSK